MDEIKVKSALLQLYFELQAGPVTLTRFREILGGNGQPRICTVCHKRPGVRYRNIYICVECWPKAMER
jgi:hypothetical protein